MGNAATTDKELTYTINFTLTVPMKHTTTVENTQPQNTNASLAISTRLTNLSGLVLLLSIVKIAQWHLS